MINKLNEILEYLNYIKSQRRVVSIVRTFMGVSFSLEVNIVLISKTDEKAVFATIHHQNISLLPHTEVTIHSDLFPKPIRAKVAQVDVLQQTATLHQFDYAQIDGENRAHIRVRPKQGLKAKIIDDQGEYYFAEVDDISVEGVSVVVSKMTQQLEMFLIPQTSIRLQINLPVSAQTSTVLLNLSATVTYINDLNGDEKIKVGLQTYPNADDRSILHRYIFDRQTAIFNEINDPSKNTNLNILL